MKWSVRRKTQTLTHSLNKGFLSRQLLPLIPITPYPFLPSITLVLPPNLIPPYPPSISKTHHSPVSNWCWPPTELEQRIKDLNLPPTLSPLPYPSSSCPHTGVLPPPLTTHSSALLWWTWLLGLGCSICLSHMGTLWARSGVSCLFPQQLQRSFL